MSDLYEQDFIGWTEQQARLLREAAARGTNLPLDWQNLAEEVESLGRSELRALESQISRLIIHLLKLEFSSAVQPRAGWLITVADARGEIRRQLRRDPGLKARLPEITADEVPDAVAQALVALRAYHEDVTGLLARQRLGTAYTQDQILGEWLPERPDLA